MLNVFASLKCSKMAAGEGTSCIDVIYVMKAPASIVNAESDREAKTRAKLMWDQKLKQRFQVNRKWSREGFSSENVVSRNATKWRGARKKALSDTWCNVKFSFCFTSKYKAIWKENLVVNQMSLRAFVHIPLH